MKLYHGTAARHLASIRKHGIRPRGRKVKGNWKHTVASNPKAVYLTNAYALYFAYNATNDDDGKDQLAILEVDTDKLNIVQLMPDEDWLEQATRTIKGNKMAPFGGMSMRTMWYRKRILDYWHLWTKSLDGLGTCCYYGTIPPSAITRVATLSIAEHHRLLIEEGYDPIIFLANYKILGEKYRNSIKRLFAGEFQAHIEVIGGA